MTCVTDPVFFVRRTHRHRGVMGAYQAADRDPAARTRPEPLAHRCEWCQGDRVAMTVTRRPTLGPVPVASAVAVPSAVAVTFPVAATRSGSAELAASVALVCRPADDGGRAMRFDRAVGQPGMAAAAGTRRHAGDGGQRRCRHCRRRGVRRGRIAPLWYQVRLAGPSLL